MVTLIEGLWGGAKGEPWGWAGDMDLRGNPLPFNFPYRLLMKYAWDCLEENQDHPSCGASALASASLHLGDPLPGVQGSSLSRIVKTNESKTK